MGGGSLIKVIIWSIISDIIVFIDSWFEAIMSFILFCICVFCSEMIERIYFD